MALGCVKGLALSVALLTLLAACYPAPYQRSYARTTTFGSYDRGYGATSYGSGYGSCGTHPCVSAPQHCPPGYILARIPYAEGGPGRYCRPHYQRWSRCCGSQEPPRPPICAGRGGCY
jgi:hypothetical protein